MPETTIGGRSRSSAHLPDSVVLYVSHIQAAPLAAESEALWPVEGSALKGTIFQRCPIATYLFDVLAVQPTDDNPAFA